MTYPHGDEQDRAFSFDPNSVPPDDRGSHFDPIPSGWYPAIVDDSEIKRSQSGWQGLKLRFSISGHEYTGRKIYTQITVACPSSAEAESIGRRQLWDLTSAMNGGQPFRFHRTDELHGRPLCIKVGMEKLTAYHEEQGLDPRNDIKAFKPLPGPSMKQQPPAQAPPYVPGPPQQAPPQQQWNGQPGAPAQDMTGPPRQPEPPPIGDDDLPF
uniref:DUF669 domain-containing protein n=1 Tax=viral metagenome TaxID=1070528 RepID=A0A6M3XNM0_9ZZZZ